MDLNFGLFLVERGVLTSHQFCGLIKIQQSQLPPAAFVALKYNFLTTGQIARIYAAMQHQDPGDFLSTAKSLGYINADQIEAVERLRGLWADSLRDVMVDCGVLNDSQVREWLAKFEESMACMRATNIAETDRSSQTDGGHADRSDTPIPSPKFRVRPSIQVHATP